MKKCRWCGSEYEDFGPKIKLCRPCKQKYDRNYYRKMSNGKKEDKNRYNELRRDRNRKFIVKFLSEPPCETCGETRVECLQFAHIDPGTKKYNVSNLPGLGVSIDTIKKEIKKCKVLCANCHMIETAEEFGWYSRVKNN